MSYPDKDIDWTEDHWKQLVQELIDSKLIKYSEVASLVLGHLNPPQVGTSVATNKKIQMQFPRRKTWVAVYDWFQQLNGICQDCGTRLELQVDHIVPKEQIGDEAERLNNLTLRCRRCNVAKRPSHRNGKKTLLTTEAALMWILFTKKPKSYAEYEKMCRDYGLTMANIRFKEAWTLKIWLEKICLVSSVG